MKRINAWLEEEKEREELLELPSKLPLDEDQSDQERIQAYLKGGDRRCSNENKTSCRSSNDSNPRPRISIEKKQRSHRVSSNSSVGGHSVSSHGLSSVDVWSKTIDTKQDDSTVRSELSC